MSHEAAAFIFPFLGLAAVLFARSGGDKVAVAVYTVGVTGMYATSACYHRGHWTPSAKRRMRRLDHSMILVGIASTYTPVAAIGLSSTTAWALLSVVWGLAVVGVVVRNLWLGSPRWVTAALYIGVGWTAAAVLPNNETLKFIDHERSRNLSSASIIKAINSIKIYFDYLVDIKTIKHNTIRQIKLRNGNRKALPELLTTPQTGNHL